MTMINRQIQETEMDQKSGLWGPNTVPLGYRIGQDRIHLVVRIFLILLRKVRKPSLNNYTNIIIILLLPYNH